MNYFAFVAEEVRAGLAALGLRSLDELVGRADLLRQRDLPLAKTAGLDLSYITTFAGPVRPSSERLGQEVGAYRPFIQASKQEPYMDPGLLDLICHMVVTLDRVARRTCIWLCARGVRVFCCSTSASHCLGSQSLLGRTHPMSQYYVLNW